MKKIEDTSRLPGLVPRICSAGRTVAAVVCAAPQTRPSAKLGQAPDLRVFVDDLHAAIDQDAPSRPGPLVIVVCLECHQVLTGPASAFAC